MRIVLIDSSLSEDREISSFLIDRMLPFLKGCEYGILHISDPMDERMRRNILKAADGIVIITPLSCGGLPSSLSALLSEMEMKAMKRNIPVCSVLYGESMAGQEYVHAENILKIWKEKCRVHLCMNIRIQGAGTLHFMKNIPVGNGILRKMNHAFSEMSDALKGNEKNDVIITAGSSFLYRKLMESYWKKKLQENGKHRPEGSDR